MKTYQLLTFVTDSCWLQYFLKCFEEHQSFCGATETTDKPVAHPGYQPQGGGTSLLL